MESAIESAAEAGLAYSTDDAPGFRRIRAGSGFRYVDAKGKPLRAHAHLQRIRSLAIPPAWNDVWICPSASGHLQATGRDARGRKQHRYHREWREVRDATKYDRLLEFAHIVPKIRRRVALDLGRKDLGRDRVLAAVVRLMDLTLIRVGNEEYARDNKSYGLTTLQDQHARIRGGNIRFCFRGKSGKQHEIELNDHRLAKIVKSCQDIPGQDLFQYYDEAGERRDVTSRDVNDYLRQAAGGADYSARDFRTWSGTVLALLELQQRKCSSESEIKRNLNDGIRVVASRLGNTPAVCRRCYIHPYVIDRYTNGKLPHGNKRPVDAKPRATSLSPLEKATVSFLQCCRREEKSRRTKSHRSAAARRIPKTRRA
jgi:DNA topoisomerase I